MSKKKVNMEDVVEAIANVVAPSKSKASNPVDQYIEEFNDEMDTVDNEVLKGKVFKVMAKIREAEKEIVAHQDAIKIQNELIAKMKKGLKKGKGGKE